MTPAVIDLLHVLTCPYKFPCALQRRNDECSHFCHSSVGLCEWKWVFFGFFFMLLVAILKKKAEIQTDEMYKAPTL